MPTYEYRCTNCEYEFEEIQTIKAPPLERCPSCNQKHLTRVIGGGAGLIFKGEGFYITDYKRGGKDGEKRETKKKETDKKETVTKPETKTTPTEKSKD